MLDYTILNYYNHNMMFNVNLICYNFVNQKRGRSISVLSDLVYSMVINIMVLDDERIIQASEIPKWGNENQCTLIIPTSLYSA
jgi:hypothetical protein